MNDKIIENWRLFFRLIKRYKIIALIVLVLLVVYAVCLPQKLFNNPTSTVVMATNNELLGAVIADDEQWRFPEIDSVPRKYKQCVLQFEDAYFDYHFGFNPISIVKALQQNIKAGRVVRGGSTLTQQVIRLHRKNRKRSYGEKLVELILATRLEWRYSKNKILKLYASHAPFGGNVVGLEMASWRYFGLQPHQLSWAESATLAVLPNAPSLIYPGKNQLQLKYKRNQLLHKLFQKAIIDSLTYQLAVEEDLPQKPYPLPTIAPHLVQEMARKYKGKRLQSSINSDFQKQINTLVKTHYEVQKQNEVYNLAVLVLDIATRKVVAYVGNSPTDAKHQKDVNNILASRSTGSILKPLLYAQMLHSGDLLPTQLLADVPTQIAGYTPKNFSLTFDGAVPANEALTRSLNISAVRMLQQYGLHKFWDDLQDYQLTGIHKPADYYGLSLILGGAEASLWDLCKVYASFAGIINHYEETKHHYLSNELVNPLLLQTADVSFGNKQEQPQLIDAGSAFVTLQTLTEVNRPESEQAWKYFNSSQKIAWKTGTSFGNKDAWAIGVTPKYVVGVWVGNSDGEGRPDLTGAKAASPLLFSIFDVLPKSEWFLEPYEDLIQEQICSASGYLARPICPSVTKRLPKNGVKAQFCPYHMTIQLDETEQFRVNSNCQPVHSSITKTWFTLPPLMAYYYRQKNASYRPLPSFREDCNELESNKMAFVYPTNYKTIISLTKAMDGSRNPIIIKLTHTNIHSKVFWYLNNQFIKQTQEYHELAIQPRKGTHVITAIDDFGNEIKRIIQVN